MHTIDKHAAAVTAIGAGHVEQGRELLRELVAGGIQVEHLNDLAVASQMTGRLDDAEALLQAARGRGARSPASAAPTAACGSARSPACPTTGRWASTACATRSR